MKISEILEQFIDEQKYRNNSPRTIEWYEENVTRFIEWLGNDEINALTLENYKRYVIYLTTRTKRNGEPYKSSSVNTYVRAIRGFYNYCIEENLIDDISRKLRATKIRREEKQVLTDSEIKKLLENEKNTCIDERNRCIMAVMLDSGLRRAEVVNLDIADVDLDNGIMLVNGKGKKQRYVPLGALTLELLTDYKKRKRKQAEDFEPFFVDRFGNRLSLNAVKMMFQKLKGKSGIDRVHAHLLRHTFATNYLVNGGDLETLRLLLGHSNLNITELYLHLAHNKKLLQDKHISHLDGIIRDNSVQCRTKARDTFLPNKNGYQNSA